VALFDRPTTPNRSSRQHLAFRISRGKRKRTNCAWVSPHARKGVFFFSFFFFFFFLMPPCTVRGVAVVQAFKRTNFYCNARASPHSSSSSPSGGGGRRRRQSRNQTKPAQHNTAIDAATITASFTSIVEGVGIRLVASSELIEKEAGGAGHPHIHIHSIISDVILFYLGFPLLPTRGMYLYITYTLTNILPLDPNITDMTAGKGSEKQPWTWSAACRPTCLSASSRS
jgi:hypothetical protein